MKITSATKLIAASAAIVSMTTATSGTALAWHPHGVITKGITNVTSGSTTVMEANSASTAVTANPGDTLNYTIVIKNDSPTKNSYDDLGSTQLVDRLPQGLTLISGQTTESIGTISAQGSVRRVITVKVNADVKNGTLIDNSACFSGEATNHESGTKQSGCDHAMVKVTVKATPTPTPTQTPTPTPSTTPTPQPSPGKGSVLSEQAPAALPQTGVSDLAGTTVGLGALSAAAVAYARSRKRS